MSNTDARRLPVVSLGAEFLVIGYLMRRNILAYKAPPNNEGYDLIAINPDPRQVSQQLFGSAEGASKNSARRIATVANVKVKKKLPPTGFLG